MICRHYIIEGNVQGVFYWVSARDQADEAGLYGWVRNLADGSVEAVACGDKQQLATLEKWFWKGPPMASVSNVLIDEWTQSADFAGFEIR